MQLMSRIVITLTIILMNINLSFSDSNVQINPPGDWVKNNQSTIKFECSL